MYGLDGCRARTDSFPLSMAIWVVMSPDTADFQLSDPSKQGSRMELHISLGGQSVRDVSHWIARNAR